MTIALANRPTDALAPQSMPADRHPVATYLRSLGSGSRRTMGESLEVIADILTSGQCDAMTLPWGGLRYQHTNAVRAALAERYAAATANKMLSALRGVLREAWRLGYLAPDDYSRAIDLKPIKGSTLPRGRCLDAGEVNALFATCCADNSPAGYRDAAMLSLLYGCGLRRSEAVGLDTADYNTGTGEVRIQGKGNRERLVYASNGAADAVNDWLVVRGETPEPMFLPIRKGGAIQHRRMTTEATYKMLAKRAKQAGVANFSPHDLRRTFIGDMLDAGADISLVQRLAGHANVTTTQRYDRRPEEAKRKASALLHVPYRRLG